MLESEFHSRFLFEQSLPVHILNLLKGRLINNRIMVVFNYVLWQFARILHLSPVQKIRHIGFLCDERTDIFLVT